MAWQIYNDDSILHMADMPSHCMDMAVFSPPFPALYAYTGETNDIGNSEDFKGDAKIHLSYFYKQLARVIKPGRVIMVHVMQIPRLKRTGEVGLHDFRGLNIRLGERAGLIYEYDWSVRKNPQAQAIRTRSRELQFAGLENDRAKSRGTLADYLIKFRVPCENKVKINDLGSWTKTKWREWWIDIAESQWNDIIETDTLNTAEAKGEDDTKHICPLQLEVIRRLEILYTNPGETVFSPFAGVGSEGYVAVGGISPKTKNQIPDVRDYYGIELKKEYFLKANDNLAIGESHAKKRDQQKDMFASCN